VGSFERRAVPTGKDGPTVGEFAGVFVPLADAVPMRARSSALGDTPVHGFLPDVPDVPEEGMRARM